jgi:hypothetical protein
MGTREDARAPVMRLAGGLDCRRLVLAGTGKDPAGREGRLTVAGRRGPGEFGG